MIPLNIICNRQSGNRICFPNRGRPPECPPGYIPEPGNPFAFVKDWVACVFRCENNYCGIYLKDVDQHECSKCDIPKSNVG
jgi:hypothetical protein